MVVVFGFILLILGWSHCALLGELNLLETLCHRVCATVPSVSTGQAGHSLTGSMPHGTNHFSTLE